jgi:ferredoxin
MVRIYYFSGTGNSKAVAEWITNIYSENEIEATLIDISENSNFYHSKNDSLFIISPTHGFNFPPIVLKFLNRLPKSQYKNKVVVINTRGGTKYNNFYFPGISGITHYVCLFYFIRKNYKLHSAFPIDTPSNWISLHPAIRKKSAIQIINRCKTKVEKITTKIINEEKYFQAFSIKNIIPDILIAPIALAYYLIGRFILAKTFYANNQCNSCNLCVKNCPVNAIKTIRDKPFWTLKCESCMKCMNLCPHKAINTNHGVILIVVIINSFFITTFINSVITERIPMLSYFNFLVNSLVFLIFLIFSYKIIHYLLRYKFVYTIINYSSFSYYKFWGRYYYKNYFKRKK